MTEQQERLFKENPFINYIIEKKARVALCGGAVVDILEGRQPKDYDVLYLYSDAINKLDLKYQYDTKTATTYRVGFTIVQALKRSKDDFDFRISQSTLQIDTNGKLKLSLHADSFDNKILIPIELAWNNIGLARNSISRIKHWEKKGYYIHEKTYKSLKKVAKLSLFDKISSFFSSSENS
jgi:hypothetical protein